MMVGFCSVPSSRNVVLFSGTYRGLWAGDKVVRSLVSSRLRACVLGRRKEGCKVEVTDTYAEHGPAWCSTVKAGKRPSCGDGVDISKRASLMRT